MDKFNVIDQTQNLESLEQDMIKWSMMPYKFRMMSDDDCQRIHGMTNTDYYNELKKKFLSNPDMENIKEGSIVESNTLYYPDYEDRLLISKELQQSPYIVIIDPYISIDELNIRYKMFNNLAARNRLFSNEYSFDIWGYNVLDMYNIVKNNNNQMENIHESSNIMETVSYEFKPIKRTIESMIFNDDKIGLCQILSNIETSKNLVEEVSMIAEKKDIIDAIKLNNYNDVLPKIVPYFTVTEMNSLAPDSNIANYEYDEWLSLLKEAIKEGNENDIINLGWNPSIEFNSYTMEYARTRQLAWLREYCPTIVDIRGIGDNLVINEASKMMVALYEQKNLYPVYIITSWTNTMFGKLERIIIKNTKYSHAGICLNSNLKNITTFKFGQESNGFDIESIDDYIRYYDKAQISVLCIFVNREDIHKIDEIIKSFAKNRINTKYNFGNLINILLKRAKKYPYPENMQLVCSQFVDTVLKLVNIDVTNKSSNLVTPQDLVEISANPKVYKLFEGYAKDYRENKIEKDIRALFERNSIKNIKYIEPIEFGEKAEMYLEELLTPKSIFINKRTTIVEPIDTEKMKYDGNAIS